MLDSIRKKRNVLYGVVGALVLFAILSIYTATRSVRCSMLHGGFSGDDVIIQHKELITFALEVNEIKITVEMAYLWVDSNSYRNDFSDERSSARLKCYLALEGTNYKIRKNKEYLRREQTGKIEENSWEWPKVDIADLPVVMSEFYKRFLDEETGEADWLYVSIKSVTLKTESGVEVITGIDNMRLCNPYYTDNWYMKRYQLPK